MKRAGFSKYGYLIKQGTLLGHLTFDACHAFQDGLATVRDKNENGETRWGYLAKSGRLAIPYMFTVDEWNECQILISTTAGFL